MTITTADTGQRSVDLPVDAMGRERWRAQMDVRSVEQRDDNPDEVGFNGHAAVFESRTWIGPKQGGFYEQVAKTAFRKTLGEADVRFLINHDPNLVLARNRSGTLRLSQDGSGLVTDADMDTRQSYTNDLVISMRRGDVSHMSFAFETVRDSWEVLDDGTELRTLEEVRLWDVSVVTYPAYDDTDAALRAVCRSLGVSLDKRHDVLRKIAEGEGLSLDNPEPGSSTRDDSQPAPATGAPLTLMQRRLQLAAAKHGFTV